jgi:hypothetical protein
VVEVSPVFAFAEPTTRPAEKIRLVVEIRLKENLLELCQNRNQNNREQKSTYQASTGPVMPCFGWLAKCSSRVMDYSIRGMEIYPTYEVDKFSAGKRSVKV